MRDHYTNGLDHASANGRRTRRLGLVDLPGAFSRSSVPGSLLRRRDPGGLRLLSHNLSRHSELHMRMQSTAPWVCTGAEWDEERENGCMCSCTRLLSLYVRFRAGLSEVRCCRARGMYWRRRFLRASLLVGEFDLWVGMQRTKPSINAGSGVVLYGTDGTLYTRYPKP